MPGLLSGLRIENRLEKLAESAGKIGPCFGHLPQASSSWLGKGVVLAGVSGLGFNPIRSQHALGLESVKNGVDRSLSQHKPGMLFKKTNDFKAVEAPAPEACQGSHFKRALAELSLPAVRRLILDGSCSQSHHCHIPCIAMYRAMRKTSR